MEGAKGQDYTSTAIKERRKSLRYKPSTTSPSWGKMEVRSPIQRQSKHPTAIMRYAANDVYKNAKRPRPSNKKDTKKRFPMTCHFGRGEPETERSFQNYPPMKGKTRVTYDMIDPEDLEFPDGWQWVKSTKQVWNGKLEKKKNLQMVQPRDLQRQNAKDYPAQTIPNTGRTHGRGHLHVHPSNGGSNDHAERSSKNPILPRQLRLFRGFVHLTISTNRQRRSTASWPKPSPKKS